MFLIIVFMWCFFANSAVSASQRQAGIAGITVMNLWLPGSARRFWTVNDAGHVCISDAGS
jgi:hypothetical protein